MFPPLSSEDSALVFSAEVLGSILGDTDKNCNTGHGQYQIVTLCGQLQSPFSGQAMN